jgi:hypothetical protein
MRADQSGSQQCAAARWKLLRLMKRVAMTMTASAILAVHLAAPSAADPTTHLKSEIDAARRDAGCPPLQLDPILNDVSQRVTGETDDYVRHAARELPTSGEIDLLSTGSGGVLKVLRERGYHTNKVRLLSGFGDNRAGGAGDNEAKAIKALVLEGQGFDVLSDCTYTRYGVSALNDDSSQGWPSTTPRAYAVASAVVAAASGTE